MANVDNLKKVYHAYNNLSVPDKDFSPLHNKAVVEETIREAEKYHKTVHEIVDDALGERIEAVASYGTYRFNRGFKSPEEYFGKKVMTKFVGEHLLDKIRVMKAANKLNGNDKFKNAILL